jgi:hypothetical protein
MYSLMIDQLGPKYLGVSDFKDIIANLWHLRAFVG